jgi:hypothetical protein
MHSDEPEKGAASSLSKLCVNFALKSTILPKDFPELAMGIYRQFQLPFCHPFRIRHKTVADQARESPRTDSSTRGDGQKFTRFQPP